ncbi:unnamed protein product [Adineta steineri]|uniref:Uncharacterized protein n=1 Tax=Adineta steineri TaxID=433720 RepID=A0A815HHG6_9BILA|nr:unnamed protein product [Adineta steineri]
MPSQSQYENLYASDLNGFQCPCSRISVSYKEFITINSTFHQVCTSDFVKDVWLNFLYGGDGGGLWFLQSRYDIRVRGVAYFQLLSLLCSISQTTIKNAVNQFVEETFVSAQAISQSSFFVQTNATIRQFKTSTTSEFSRTLQLIRDITHGNTFISSFRLNWRWLVVGKSDNSTVPIGAISPTNNCSCGTRSDCVQPGGIYMLGYNYGLYGGISTPNTQMFAMPGFNVGCSSVETLLRSTFECLYNQTCIDQLQMFATTIFPTIPNATDYITAMSSTFVSRFQPNTTIVDIINELFIEQWQFAEETFVSAQAISQTNFFVQTDVIIRQFQTSTTSEFSGTLQLIRDITHGNTFISSYGLNWQWWVLDESGNSTLPTRAISPTDNCSCGSRSDCVKSGGIYTVGYNFEPYGIPNINSTQMFAMPGFNVGCSSVDTLFQSTFECLYNQTCIDQLQMFATTIGFVIPAATDYIMAMNSTFVSRFQPNTTIVDIVNELFIEQWQLNISYTKFYEQCAPMYCSYKFEKSPTFIYIVTRTIGIYGGLTVALRYISLYMIQLGSYIVNRYRNNRVASLT